MFGGGRLGGWRERGRGIVRIGLGLGKEFLGIFSLGISFLREILAIKWGFLSAFACYFEGFLIGFGLYSRIRRGI